jgi:hypothetical protein
MSGRVKVLSRSVVGAGAEPNARLQFDCDSICRRSNIGILLLNKGGLSRQGRASILRHLPGFPTEQAASVR